MKRYNIFIFTILFLLSNISYSQIGGNSTYEFLNLTNSARISALGGDFLAIKDDDITLALSNPSLITDKMDNDLSFSFVNYFSDINMGFVSYSKSFEKHGSFVASMQFVDYGRFTYADETGQTFGKFVANEYAFNIGWARQLDSSFSIGSNLKTIYSCLETYKSYGIAVDVAATYNNSKKHFTSSLIAKNIGRQIKTYRDGNKEPLPFEIQIGLSKKLEKAPVRFSILINHLEKFDLTYEDPNNPVVETDPLTDEPLPEKKFEKAADKVMRHFVFGGELMPTKNFSILLGYNYQRRKELKIESKVSTVGFSWGFGFKISKINFSYGRATYHLAGAPNHITITTNISNFIKE